LKKTTNQYASLFSFIFLNNSREVKIISREKSFVKNTIIYAIGNLLSKCLSFVLLPFYTAYFTTTDYGYFDLITTTVALVIPLVTFDICDGMYRFLLDVDRDEDRHKIITNTLIILILNLAVSNSIYLLFIHFVKIQFGVTILIMTDISVIYSIWAQIARGYKKNVEYSISGVMVTFIMLFLNIVLVLFTNLRVEALILATLVSNFIVLIYLEYKLRVLRSVKIILKDTILIKKIINYSFPLIANLISWWVMNVSDRFILKYFMGMSANGIYAIANKFPSMFVMFSSIFTLAWQESAITEYESKDRDNFYTKMFNAYMIFGFTACILLIAFTKVIMIFMIKKSFGAAWRYVPFLYLGALFSAFSSFYGVGYQSSKKTKGAFTTSVFGAIFNIVFNIFMVPILGIQAASLSTMLAFLIMWIARVYETRKYFKIDLNKKNLLSLTFITIIYVIIYYYGYKFTDIILMGLSIVIFIVYNKKLISKAATPLKNRILKIS
jgi:O-antigen/teichoic acid export membrane protein